MSIISTIVCKINANIHSDVVEINREEAHQLAWYLYQTSVGLSDSERKAMKGKAPPVDWAAGKSKNEALKFILDGIYGGTVDIFGKKVKVNG